MFGHTQGTELELDVAAMQRRWRHLRLGLIAPVMALVLLGALGSPAWGFASAILCQLIWLVLVTVFVRCPRCRHPFLGYRSIWLDLKLGACDHCGLDFEQLASTLDAANPPPSS